MGGIGSGRPGKPASFHKLAGTFRKDRHGGKGVHVDGEPRRPRGLPKDAAALWEAVVEKYRGRGVLTELDTSFLQSTCEIWSLYRSALAEAQKNPTDKVARVACISYWQAFASAAAKLGLDPASRARLKVEPVERIDKLGRIIGLVNSRQREASKFFDKVS